MLESWPLHDFASSFNLAAMPPNVCGLVLRQYGEIVSAELGLYYLLLF